MLGILLDQVVLQRSYSSQCCSQQAEKGGMILRNQHPKGYTLTILVGYKIQEFDVHLYVKKKLTILTTSQCFLSAVLRSSF